jgi:chemotaxis protein CheD
LKSVSLGIAEIVVTDEACEVSTVLGSCVSVCLHAGNHGAGGIIHFALPRAPAHIPDPECLRYGDLAVPFLIAKLHELTGAAPSTFTAKIVGGANNFGETGSVMDIGGSNIELARECLASNGIPIVGELVGGTAGRKVLFCPHTGQLRVASLTPI